VHGLEVQGVEEHEAEQREADQQRDRVGAGERRVPEHAQRQHRRAAAGLHQQERHQGHGAEQQQRHDHRRAPAALVALDQPEGDRAQPDRAEHQPRQVKPAGGGVAGLGDHPPGDQERRHPDRQVDVEHPAPAERVGEQPAQHRAGGQRHRRHPRPQADRLHPLPRVGEGGGEDRQGARQQRRAPDRLQRPPADQRRQARRQPAQRRAGGEHHQPGAEHPPAAEPVAERAGGQQQAGEHQHVGVDHQLQPGHAGTEVALDARQGHVHDGVVQHHHEQPEAAGPQGQQLDGAVGGEHAPIVRQAVTAAQRSAAGRSHHQPADGDGRGTEASEAKRPVASSVA
jgi:hypothetical protein